MAWKLRVEPYDPDAIDADNDGIVQEGTAWERPAGSRLLDEIGNEIQRGLTSSARPQLRVIGTDGIDIDYKPSYGKAKVRGKGPKKTTLGSLGYPSLSERGSQPFRSLKEMGFASIEDLSKTVESEILPEEAVDKFDDALYQVKKRISPEQQIAKRFNRDRAFRRADEKARELSFLGGDHYLIETEKEFVVMSQRDYDQLIQSVGGPGNILGDVTVTRYGKPKAESGGLEEVKAGLIGPTRIDSIDDAKYRDAVAQIHYGSGAVESLDDDIFAAAIFDESIMFDGPAELSLLNPQGVDMTFEDIMTGNFDPSTIDDGMIFQNRRFTFKAIKGNKGDGYGGLWTVFKVTDKETDDVWYIKASTFGVNDGMVENIGMEASSLLDLAAKNDIKEIRTGVRVPVVDWTSPNWNSQSGRQVRWTAMKSIEAWDTPTPLKMQMDADGETSFWLDALELDGLDAENVIPEDIAQITVMDYILDNLDRHDGNFKVAYDEQGNQRLGVIDNGLMGLGRGFELLRIDFDEEILPEELDDLAEGFSKLTPAQYGSLGNGNTIFTAKNMPEFGARLHNDPEVREQFQDACEETIKRFRANIDRLLSAERMESRGIALSSVEKRQLEAIKTIAMKRLSYLEENRTAILDAMLDIFPN